MVTKIAQAIRNRQILICQYNGGERIVEPHCVGYGREQQPLLRCYQTAGHSESGRLGWKLFRVDRIDELTNNGETFEGPRQGYN
ncbi:WYL domain-containing protein [Salidesulfovibrio brasiliensis]|uniref:WYL domain-containing protein n=1 Tax=Salidesulfovibrio brasiliensis TaxID=221711 RepID=UPI0006CF2500|nr:WYL domain-containing protein [Salidesulfovibrio brasiliensis]